MRHSRRPSEQPPEATDNKHEPYRPNRCTPRLPASHACPIHPTHTPASPTPKAGPIYTSYLLNHLPKRCAIRDGHRHTTTHRSIAESAATLPAPCSPKQHRLRGQHTEGEQAAPRLLQIVRDRYHHQAKAALTLPRMCRRVQAYRGCVASCAALHAPCNYSRRHLHGSRAWDGKCVRRSRGDGARLRSGHDLITDAIWFLFAKLTCGTANGGPCGA